MLLKINKFAVPQHVAIYLPSLRGGGAERVMLTLANAFAERGLQVDLVLALAEGPYLKDVSPTIRMIDLKAGRVMRSLPSLIHYLRCERPDAMITALNYVNVIAILARALARVNTRLVVSEHNTPTVEASNNKGFLARIVYRLMHWLYPRADGIVAVSNGVADALSRFADIPRQCITTVYNPFDLHAIQEKAAAPINHPWFGPGEPGVILGIGRLTAQKDFSCLIRAFACLRTKRTARLMILGEGEQRNELQALATSLNLGSNDFCLHGFTDNPYSYLHQCKIFVLSSRWEGLPTVVIEALACGAPVVSTDCPSGPAEILENGRWGKLVPVGNIELLAQAMTETLDEIEHSDGIKRANDFAEERAVNGYFQVLFPLAKM